MASAQRRAENHIHGLAFSGNARTHIGNHIGEFNQYLPQERPETPPAPFSNVPFPRDPDFVDRVSITDCLDEKLARPAARVALVGLGGVGKSQLAIEYAYRLRERSGNNFVLWLHASSASRFEQSVCNALEDLKVPGRNNPSAHIYRLLRSWLREAKVGRKWLVIIDNADDSCILNGPPGEAAESQGERYPTSRHEERRIDYLPVCDHGTVLLTTRNRDAALRVLQLDDIVQVDPMDEDQACTLLANRLGDSHKGSATALGTLSRRLDHMPLALAQAASYIRRKTPRCSVHEYIDKLDKSDRSQLNLLTRNDWDSRRDRGSLNSILLTWEITFTHIQHTHPSAVDLLSLMSFFDRQTIPEDLIRNRDPTPRMEIEENWESREEERGKRPEEHSKRVEELEELRNQARTLLDQLKALLNRVFEIHALSNAAHPDFEDNYHELVQFGNQARTVLDEYKALSNRCSEIHALSVAAYSDSVHCDNDVRRSRDSLDSAKNSLLESKGQSHEDCENLCHDESASDTGSEDFEDDLQLLMDYSLVATTTNSAVFEMHRLVQIATQRWLKLNKRHEHWAECFSRNLCYALRFGQRCDATLSAAYRRIYPHAVMALKLKLVTEGALQQRSWLLDTIRSHALSNGAIADAEIFQCQVSDPDVAKTLFGEQDLRTLPLMYDVGLSYLDRFNFAAAETIFTEAIELAKHDGAFLQTIFLALLALTYARMKRPEEAERLQLMCVEKLAKHGGVDEAGIVILTNIVAPVYNLLGKHREAERLLEKNLELAQKKGFSLLDTMQLLASTYRELEKHEEAEEMEVQAMERFNIALGKNLTKTFSRGMSLAQSQLRYGRPTRAINLAREFATKSTQQLGPKHSITLGIVRTLEVWSERYEASEDGQNKFSNSEPKREAKEVRRSSRLMQAKKRKR